MMEATAVRERPILFSAPMIRAVLGGRKTQTRRVVKPQPEDKRYDSGPLKDIGGLYWKGSLVETPENPSNPRNHGESLERLCPYGHVGDRLWVREATELVSFCGFNVPGATLNIRYKADWEQREFQRDASETVYASDKRGVFYGVTPSIHMPRWASRITLEITDIRVQRLQEISEEDAKAEGIGPKMVDSGGFTPWDEGIDVYDYTMAFFELWDSINASRGFPFVSNPWVWAITFKRLTEEPAK